MAEVPTLIQMGPFPKKKIYFYEKPFKKTMRQLIAGQGWKWKENNIKKIFSKVRVHNVR